MRARRLMFGVGLVGLVGYLGYVQLVYASLSDDLTETFDSYSSHVYSSNRLEDFPIHAQLKRNTCGLATITMLSSFLEGATDEVAVTRELGLEDRTTGMSPGFFNRNLNSVLDGYSSTHLKNVPDSEVVTRVITSIDQGLPVGVLFSTVSEWDWPKTDTHLSVVIGYDLVGETFTIANAYGFEEEIDIRAFLGMLKYENHVDSPFLFDLIVLLNIQGKNNLFVVEPS